MNWNKIKKYLLLFKEAYQIYNDNHPVKFASAIAYFGLFALPSIFLIIVYFLSFIFSRTEILRELREQLGEVLGDEGADILVVITENYEEQASQNFLMVIIYVIIVFWLSTQLFRLFQNSLNDLWRIKPDFDNFWRRIWVERILTFCLVIATGLLFYASLVVERALEFSTSIIPGDQDLNVATIEIIVNIITVIFVFFWFSLLYKVLPAVKIKWEPTFIGAAVTTFLFFLGIWLIWEFVVERELEDIYDWVSSIIVVALWIFYSSLIFLYGASLTKAYARFTKKQIEPASYAYKYKIVRDDDFYEE